MECNTTDVEVEQDPGIPTETSDHKKERIVYDPLQLKELNKPTNSPPPWLDLDSIPEEVKKGPKKKRVQYEREFLRDLVKGSENPATDFLQSIPVELRKGTEHGKKPMNVRTNNRKIQELSGKKYPHWTNEQAREDVAGRPRSRTRSISTGVKPKLHKATNPWKPTTRTPADLVVDKIENSKRIARRILNKLTEGNINQMRTELQTTIQDDDEITNAVAPVFYELALSYGIHFHWFIETVSKMLSPGEQGSDTPAFKKLADKIVELCEFNYEGCSSRMRRLGCGKLLGQLYNHGLVESAKIVDIINSLLATEVEENYEQACQLLKIVGEKLEGDLKSAENHSSSLTETFQRISVDLMCNRFQELMDRSSLSSRIRFGIMDVIEMRKNGWKPRSDPNSLRSFDEFRLSRNQKNLLEKLDREQKQQERPRNGYTGEAQHESEQDSGPSWRQDNSKRRTPPNSSASEQPVARATEAAAPPRAQIRPMIGGNAGGISTRASPGSSPREIPDTPGNSRSPTQNRIPPGFSSNDASVHGSPSFDFDVSKPPPGFTAKRPTVQRNGFVANKSPRFLRENLSPRNEDGPSSSANNPSLSFGTPNISPRNNEPVSVQSTQAGQSVANAPSSGTRERALDRRELLDNSTQDITEKCVRLTVRQAVSHIFDDYRTRGNARSTVDCIQRSFGETSYFVSELARQVCTMTPPDQWLAMDIIKVLLNEGRVTKSLVTQSLKIGITSQMDLVGVEVRAECLSRYLSNFLVELYENEEDQSDIFQLRYGSDSIVQPQWDLFVSHTMDKLNALKMEANRAKAEEEARRVGVGIIGQPPIPAPAMDIPSNAFNPRPPFPLDQRPHGTNIEYSATATATPRATGSFSAPGSGYAHRSYSSYPMVVPAIYHHPQQQVGYVPIPMVRVPLVRGRLPFGNSHVALPQPQQWNPQVQSMLTSGNRNGPYPSPYVWSREQQQQNETLAKQEKFINEILQKTCIAVSELARMDKWKDAVEIIQAKFPQFYVPQEISMLTPENEREFLPTAAGTMEILLSPQHYDITSVPTYQGSNKVGCFEITETGAQSSIVHISKLNHIWSRFGSDAKPKDNFSTLEAKHVACHKQKQEHFLFWLMQEKYQERIQNRIGFRNQSKFICISEHLEQILLTSILDKWELYATKVRGSIYLWNDATKDSMDAVLEGFYANNLADILTSKDPPGSVATGKSYQVNEVSFGSHRILVLVDTHAVGDTGETYGIEAYKIDSVDLNLKQSKCWGRSIISGRQKLILGVLDKDGLVKTLDTMTWEEIQRKFRVPASAYFELQDRLLKWIQSHFQYAVAPMVKKFSWTSGTPTPAVVCTSVEANEVPSFFKTEFFTKERNC